MLGRGLKPPGVGVPWPDCRGVSAGQMLGRGLKRLPRYEDAAEPRVFGVRTRLDQREAA